MKKPTVAVVCGNDLFASFFDEERRERLSCLADWQTAADWNEVAALEVAVAISGWDTPYLSEEVARSIKTLKMIGHCGGEVKRHFAPALFETLTITNAPSALTMPTAELGVTLLLDLARRVTEYSREMQQPSNVIYEKMHREGTGSANLFGARLGMIGFGRIGRAMVELMRGFNVRWEVFDPYVDQSLYTDLPVTFLPLTEVLVRNQFVTVVAASTPETRDLLNKETLSRMQDGGCIINIARGALIDLDALTEEVLSGRLRCALDVTDPLEPLPVSHPLRGAAGAILTPHIAGGGPGVRGAMTDIVLGDLERFLKGEPVENRVTRAMLERMT